MIVAWQRDAACSSGAVEPLLRLLDSPVKTRSEAALHALASLSPCAAVAKLLTDHPGMPGRIDVFLKGAKSRVRLAACVTLTNIAATLEKQDPHNKAGRRPQGLDREVW